MAHIRNFYFWCQKVLPLVYDNSLSYYEVLCKVTHKLNELIDALNKTNDQVLKNTNAIEDLQTLTSDIQALLEKIKNGDYVDLYLDSIINWIDKNLQEIVARIVKQVYFGLTDDGYFYADIPDSWSDITFGTIMDYNNPNYGHLTLSYSIGGVQ